MAKPGVTTLEDVARRQAAMVPAARVKARIQQLQEEREEVRVMEGQDDWDREWALAQIDADIRALYNRNDWNDITGEAVAAKDGV